MHDHRRLGRELDLFDTDPLMGAGLPYWLPDGAIVRHELEEYVRELERAAGYRHVYSPVLGKRELYEISGHWSHYSDDMFPPMKLGAEEVVLRPSLCPHHALIYRSRSHSYRELPLRMAELGAMYRSELSGVLGGLTRVRAIQLNDAHIFCTWTRPSTRPAKPSPSSPAPTPTSASAPPATGSRCRARAASTLRIRPFGGEPPRCCARSSTTPASRTSPPRARPPSTVRRSTSRSPTRPAARPPSPPSRSTSTSPNASTCTTSAPTGKTPAGHGAPQRHRERGTGGGAPRGGTRRGVPALARPRAAGRPASVGGAGGPGPELLCRAQQRGLRAELAAPGDGSLGARVRAARLTPYQAVVGEREAADGLVAVRLRDGRRIGPLAPAELLHHIGARVEARGTALWADA